MTYVARMRLWSGGTAFQGVGVIQDCPARGRSGHLNPDLAVSRETVLLLGAGRSESGGRLTHHQLLPGQYGAGG